MKVFLYAYDWENLGDDLFIRFLTDRYPGTDFYMWSESTNKKIFADVPNLHIRRSGDRISVMLNKIRPSLRTRYVARIKNYCDCCVYIGGSIFQQYPTWKDILNWWDYHTQRYPFYVLGANFGPYSSEAYREGMAEIFSQVKDICFRDHYSYQLFAQRQPVRVAPDILFAQPMPNRKEKKQVLISVINGHNGQNQLEDAADQYEDCLYTMIQDYIQHGYKVKLASFCKVEGDEEVCERLLNRIRLSNDEISTCYYNGFNVQEMLDEISSSEYIIGTRFHSCVLGLSAGKKILPLIYSDKTKHMLEDIGFDGLTLDLRNNFRPVMFDELSQSKRFDVAELKQNAVRHFEQLDLFLT